VCCGREYERGHQLSGEAKHRGSNRKEFSSKLEEGTEERRASGPLDLPNPSTDARGVFLAVSPYKLLAQFAASHHWHRSRKLVNLEPIRGVKGKED